MSRINFPPTSAPLGLETTARRSSSGQFFAALNYEGRVTFEQRPAGQLAAEKSFFIENG
jgi:hypothetical protein